ncbi:hypothetical protein [Paenibacillus sp. MER 99-2]|uniref:hypothetical protein n=1 Tax=Paenibacillus sp. MER 99-2 TaxID=2939572 RepID=UPI002040862C|nr:hypothetical protein [Paenibacillus sp. MER 99-2]MCM3172893.1 hypothetical protein [Paenibacillus sp. MER 99-2]
MSSILTPYLTHPLEREFEAWVVSNIQDYYKKINIDIQICAVSPFLENSWPADEVIYHEGKLIGLQFKQAHLTLTTSKVIDYSRLNWDIRNPAGQYELIQKHPEIYYALPTFVNRKWKDDALHHCIFWRPDDVKKYNAWYNNPSATDKKSYKNIRSHPNSFRWGEFVERISNCEIGKIQDKISLNDYLINLKKRIKEQHKTDRKSNDISNKRPENEVNEQMNHEVLYLIHIPMKS